MRERFQLDFQQAALISLAAISIATALSSFAWTAIVWSRWHAHLPWRDLFVILDDLKPILAGESIWRSSEFLFDAHYAAHRITIPRILVYLDLAVFRGQSHVLYAAGWSALLLIFCLYACMAREFFRESKALAWFSCGLIGIILFSPAHSWNLINAINTSWHISYALGVSAFYLLIRTSEAPRAHTWLLAYGLATLAAFTNFAGVIVWLLLPVLAVRSSRTALILAVSCSVLMTLIYLNGIISDAEIAASWNAGNPDVAAKIQQTGKEALDNQSVAQIFTRTARVLSWPFSNTHPTQGIVLFASSLLILTVGWIQFFKAAIAGRRLDRWTEWCLMLATLSLGVGIAIQMGRMIEQPNHAHGPSYERYNTIVAMYWTGVFSVLAGALPRFPILLRLATMLSMLLIVYHLVAPSGRYLEQEINSAEAAARLFVAGETPTLKEKIDSRMLRFKPEYVYTFEPIFESRSIAYRAPLNLPDGQDIMPDCDLGSFNIAPYRDERTEVEQVHFTFNYLGSMLVRDVVISRNGLLLSRLIPVHQGDYSPRQLVVPGFNHWSGHIKPGTDLANPVQLMFNLIGGIKHSCILQADSLEKFSRSITSATE